jgi:hypothetical protein
MDSIPAISSKFCWLVYMNSIFMFKPILMKFIAHDEQFDIFFQD